VSLQSRNPVQGLVFNPFIWLSMSNVVSEQSMTSEALFHQTCCLE